MSRSKKKRGIDFDRAEATVRRACREGYVVPEDLTVTQWADRYRRLSPENSAEAGLWKTSRTPYLAGPMDAFTDDRVERITIVAASQVGKTELMLNMLGYVIDQDPGPAMYCTPSLDTSQDFSKRRFAPMVRDCPRLKRLVSDVKGRDSKNTTLKKTYPGGMLTFVGSNSAAGLASIPSRYVFGDEVDRWAHSAGTEGDPLSLLEARTRTFYNRKIVTVSTPTVEGASKIADEFMQGTQEYWCVECPECGEPHYIDFNSIRFEYHKTGSPEDPQYVVDSAEYLCPSCGALSDEAAVRRSRGCWVAKNPEAIENRRRSFWINAFVSPWASWKSIVLSFLEARDDPERLQVVFNTMFGQLWEERGEIANVDELADAREDYPAELPDGVLCLTCGVDTQDNRLEYEVVGHGMFDETWGIQRGVLWGRPDAPDTDASPNVWTQLDSVLDRHWRYADGKTLKISVTFVDSGGHHTQDVYRECAARLGKRVFAVKGRGGEGVPFTSPPSKQVITVTDARGRARKANVWLYGLGVDAGKEKIMSALLVREPGARFCHFPAAEERGYDAAFFNGLASERMVRTPAGKWQWKKLPGHRRNEALDCRNYALAAFSVLAPDMAALERARRGAPKKTARQGRRRRVSKGVSV